MSDAQHAKLSPSGAKRWMACAGSVTLEAPFPDTSSTYSDDGTAMHLVAAWCLTEHWPACKRIGEAIRVSHEGEPPRYVDFTDDMAMLVQEYVDTVRVLGIGHRVWVEQRVDLSEDLGLADQFGTADAIVLNERDGELTTIDLKTGYRFVPVENNSQLMLYALGALRAVVTGTLEGEVRGKADHARRPAAPADAQPGQVRAALPEAAANPAQEAEGDDDLF